MAKSSWRFDWLICYAGSTLVVLGGVAFGRAFVTPAPRFGGTFEPFLQSFVHWDATYYRAIAQSGYRHDPRQQSSIHFFPLYPLVSRGMMRATGLSAEAALLLVAHASFLATLYLLARYTDLRHGASSDGVRLRVLLALCFIPAGLFFRVAYSESLFLALALLALLLIEKAAPPVVVACVIGLATAARPVGLALILPLAAYLLHHAKSRWAFFNSACLSLTLALSGLLAFMVFCAISYGDPIAFAHNMSLWSLRSPPPSFEEKCVYLTVLLPIWDVFAPSSPAYWGHRTTPTQAVFSLYLANPIYCVIAWLLLAWGWRQRWLTVYEALASLGLLIIPYWCAAYETNMSGMARYVSVAFPLYLVLGRLLEHVPAAVTAVLLGCSAFFLAAYAALFAKGYWFV